MDYYPASKKRRKTLSYVTIWMNLEDIMISEIAFQVPLEVKNPPASEANARNMGSISGLGRYPGEGNGYPLPVFLAGEFHRQRSLAD